jgi:hypothetical protein
MLHCPAITGGAALPAFAAAFLGATTVNPGRFNPRGAMISVYFLVTGITGLSILGVSTFVQDLFYGGAGDRSDAIADCARARRAAGVKYRAPTAMDILRRDWLSSFFST